MTTLDHIATGILVFAVVFGVLYLIGAFTFLVALFWYNRAYAAASIWTGVWLVFAATLWRTYRHFNP